MEHLQQVVYHRLLARQLAKYLPEEWVESEAFMPFLEAVNHAYQDFEADLRQLERTLELSTKESFKELKDLKEAIDAAAKVMLFDKTGQVRYFNGRLQNLLRRVHLGGELGKTVLLSEDKRLNEEIWETINSGTVWIGEYSVSTLDGDKVWLKDTIVPFLNEQGFPTRFLSIKFNITDQKKAQQELKKAQQLAEDALQSKSEFLSVMSHEIRTPLNAVIGISQLLLEEDPMPGQKEKLELLKFASENLLSLINNILDYNKLEAGKIELEENQLDIHRFLHSTVKSYQFKAKEKGIDIQFVHAPESLLIKTDQTRLAQIVNNLVANAIKFTQRGKVTVTLKTGVPDNERIPILIEVTDTGTGIAKENFAKIFELFTQESNAISRKYGGTGLGLAISNRIAELMGGSITLESELGYGSTFAFKFNAQFVNSTVGASGQMQDKHIQKSLGLKVLVIDDNELNVFVARQVLKKWACEVDEALSGEVGLQKALVNKYDVILLDLQMPGLDGFQTMEGLKQQGNEAVVIALTADSDKDVRQKVLESGMKEVMLKPFAHQELFDLLQSATRR